jgi:hypothetical protein
VQKEITSAPSTICDATLCEAEKQKIRCGHKENFGQQAQLFVEDK